MYLKLSFYVLFGFSLLFCCKQTSAQSSDSSDDLFKNARTTSFNKKDYAAAIALSKQALAISPNYADIQIFMARNYAWNNQYDSARRILADVVQKKPAYIDAWSAAADVESWDDQYMAALELCNKGLQQEPTNKELLLKKAKVLKNLQRNYEASSIVKQLLKIDSGNTEVRRLANS